MYSQSDSLKNDMNKIKESDSINNILLSDVNDTFLSYIEQKLEPFTETSTRQQIKLDLLNNDQSNCIGFLNRKNAATAHIGKEPWPEDVKLYQPYETEQILLPDMANCQAVQAFLKMCVLDFSVEYKVNAEDMSPSGRVPFIKCGACLVSDLEPITNFVASKGISLTDNLDAVQKSDMRAYMSLVNTVLGNAENYITWVEPETYSYVTKPRYGSVHPFPLNHILTYLKRQSVIKRLSALGWYRKTLDKVYEEVDRACRALSERLGKQRFFFGEKPSELDALVFGHIYSILTYPSFPAGLQFADTLRRHKLLIRHCKTMMFRLDYSENIDCPVFHKILLRRMEQKGASVGMEVDEFIYDESDEEDDLSKSDYTQIAQDYSCLVNEKNTIYESLVDNTLNDNELEGLHVLNDK